MNLISRLWQFREGEGCEATLGKLSQPIVKEVLNFDNFARNVTWHVESHLIEIFTVTLWTLPSKQEPQWHNAITIEKILTRNFSKRKYHA